MKIEKFTFEYQETRSHSYQSVKAGVSIEVTLEEGDTYEEAFKKVRQQVRRQVAETADKSLATVLDNKRSDI